MVVDNFQSSTSPAGAEKPATRFYRHLPKPRGPSPLYPRVLGLRGPSGAHYSRFEHETLQRFVRGFQRVQPLTVGELWAVPIALRVVLVENLRRLAERIVQGRTARHEADALANELLGLGGQPARPLAYQRLEAAPLATAFTVQLVQRLRDQDPYRRPPFVLDTRRPRGALRPTLVRFVTRVSRLTDVRNVTPHARFQPSRGVLLRERQPGR